MYLICLEDILHVFVSRLAVVILVDCKFFSIFVFVDLQEWRRLV